METDSKCSVCLLNSSQLIKTCEKDADDVKLSCKLNSCVPEVEWNEDYLICHICVVQLEAACAFRKLCLQSKILHKRQWEKYLKNEEVHDYVDDVETDIEHESVVDDEDIKHIHRCKYCGLKFNDRKFLTVHNKNTHQSDRPYDCIYCDKSFRTSSDVSHHEKIHLNERIYECELCNTSYNTTSILRKHKIIKHMSSSEWKYFCPHCNLKYPFKSSLGAHIHRHHTTASNEYICFHCNKKFKSKLLLISHIRIKHTTRKSTKLCDKRQTIYPNETCMERYHQKENEDEIRNSNKTNKKHECNKCLRRYTTEKAMKNHYANCDGIKRHTKNTLVKSEEDNKSEIKFEPSDIIAIDLNQVKDEESLKNGTSFEQENLNIIFKDETTSLLPSQLKRGKKRSDYISNTCQICGMIFNTRYLAKRHIRNVHATEKNYHCDICEQKFASLVYLNAHKRYHSGDRPHICSFCGKGFITGSDLYHHEKIHANKRAYKCDKCPKAFNTSSDLHKHKLCVHQDRNEWKYVCSFCDRRFPLKTNLDAHTKTHTGERNFACHLCDRKCVNRSVLLRHIKSHSNVRLFKCTICHMEYKYQKSLDIHMAKAHGIGNAKIPERIKKYFCHICPKSYFANNKLQKHIRTHTGERPFACQLCEKRFIDKSYVKQHLRSAHNLVFCETNLSVNI